LRSRVLAVARAGRLSKLAKKYQANILGYEVAAKVVYEEKLS